MKRSILVLFPVLAAVLVASCGGGQQAASPSRPAGVIDRFEIVSDTDAYGGASFGSAGPYRVVSGIVHGKLDPKHPANAGIVDLALAPVDADGYVAYTTDVVILRPKSAASAKPVLFYDVPNRGAKVALTVFDAAGAGFAADAQGNGFLLNQGYTMVWSGWQGDIPQSGTGGAMGTSFPALDTVTGKSRDEFVLDNTTNPATLTLSYPAASTDTTGIAFNWRESWKTANGMSWSSPSQDVAPGDWSFVSERQVKLTRPAAADAGAIYSFVYTAKRPVVMGIGFAAVRDLVSFLRHDAKDAQGNANPVGDLTFDAAIGAGFSLSGRFLRDFLWQGFNDDARGHKVFDGLLPMVAGARRTFTNFRFGQPGRFSREHEDHFQPGDQFPFAYATTTDPVTGLSDGLLARCSANDTCPKVVNVDGSFEFWQGRAALGVTDGAGHDIAVPDTVRHYFVPGTSHGGGSGWGTALTLPQCRNATSPVRETAVLRASAKLLENWLLAGTAPPASNVGSIAAGTLVATTSGALNTLAVTDYGDAIPIADLSRRYDVRVPAVDADGNERSGVRVPEIAAPLATYTGWNVRAAGFAADEACSLFGSQLPFTADALQSRYPGGKADFVSRVRAAAQALVTQGFLLAADVDGYATQAQGVTVLP
jgi:hypothetical protein